MFVFICTCVCSWPTCAVGIQGAVIPRQGVLERVAEVPDDPGHDGVVVQSDHQGHQHRRNTCKGGGDHNKTIYRERFPIPWMGWLMAWCVLFLINFSVQMWFNKVEKVHNAGLRHWAYFFVYPRRAILHMSKTFFFLMHIFSTFMDQIVKTRTGKWITGK